MFHDGTLDQALRTLVREVVREVLREELPRLLPVPPPQRDERDRFINVEAAAELLSVTPGSIRSWVHEGKLRYHRVAR
jgi:hypothetical protein